MRNFKHFALTVLVALVGNISAFAYDFEVDGIYYNTLSLQDLTCEVTYKNYEDSYSGDVVIPSSVTYAGKTFKVTSIGDHAFSWCSGLTSINIPNSVTEIGQGAFIMCSNLTSIEIPNSVKKIECATFSNCSSLTAIKIPNSVTIIDSQAFEDCSNLLSVIIPNSVNSIGPYAFSNCSSLTAIEIPSSVSQIYNVSFQSCPNLKEITFLGLTPPYVVIYAATNGPSKVECVLKVPEEALDAYKAADYWKEFWNIVPIPSDIKENILYNGNSEKVKEEGGLEKAQEMLVNSTAANALVFSNTKVSGTSEIPVANIVALNNDNKNIAKEIIITDSEPFYSPSEVTADQISYLRNFTSNAWQALYVPFAMKYEDWKDYADVAYINNVHQLDDDKDGVIERTILEFITKTSGSIQPNTPYVIKPKQTGEVTFTSKDTKLHAASGADGFVDCMSTTNKYTLYGTYQEKTDMYANGYYAMSDGGFKQAENASVKLSPFRTYLKIESRTGAGTVQNAKRIGIMVDGVMDNDATGIEEITQNSSLETQNCYNLAGQKVGRGYKGIAIKNGKKYIIK